jgi:hypothetical protein
MDEWRRSGSHRWQTKKLNASMQLEKEAVMAIEAIEEEQTKVPTLIRTFGEYWNPDLVNWARSWNLLGTASKSNKGPDLNAYEERGVYVLYNDYVPVYVGKAFRQSIGYRLQLHRESRRKGSRWDSFSWFGLRGFKTNGELRKLSRIPAVRPEALIETLEALLIVIVDPKLNSRRETLKGAIPLYQSLSDRPMDTEQRLEGIEKKLELLVKKSAR